MRISELDFTERKRGDDGTLFLAYTDLGRITVLDRMTGWGVRDIETGYKDKEGRFWLGSGGFDIRKYPDLELSEAIDKIKACANTCVGV